VRGHGSIERRAAFPGALAGLRGRGRRDGKSSGDGKNDSHDVYPSLPELKLGPTTACT
jgi:hypothetical protein